MRTDIAKRKLSKPILAYHGTSSERLRSILKIGLTPDAKGRWEKDDSHGLQRSRISYGGVYLTQNFVTAYSSASNLLLHEKSTANRLIVIASIQPMTTIIDEDIIRLDINMNDYEIAKDWVLIKAGKWNANSAPKAHAVLNKLLKHSRTLSIYDDDDNDDDAKHLRQDDSQLYKLAEDAVRAEIARQAAHRAASESFRLYIMREAYAVTKGMWTDRVKAEFMPIEITKAETALRKSLDAFSRKLKSHIPQLRQGSKYTDFRVTNPIKFSGANKIIAITEIKKDRIIMHYGNLPDDFKSQYKLFVGELPPVVRASDLSSVDVAIAHPDSYEYFKFSGARGVTLYRVERGKDSERILKTGDTFGVKPSSRKDLMSVIFPDAPGKAYYVPSSHAKRILRFSAKVKSNSPESGHAPSAPAHLIHTRNSWLHADPKDKGSRATWIWFVLSKWINIHRGVKVLPIDLYEECARLHNGLDRDKLADKTIAKAYEMQLLRGRRAVVKVFGFRLRLSDVSNLAAWIKDPRIKPKGAAALLMAEHDKRWKVANGKYIPIRFPAVKMPR